MRRAAKNVTAADTVNANMPIYTKTGDTGSTSLFGGKRVLKCEELVDVYGSIDELNSWIGKVASDIDSSDVVEFLENIQSDLFTIGSHLAGWPARNASQRVAGGEADLKILPHRVKEMEARIDVLDDTLPKLKNFILPGGTKLASDIHLARAVCRRVERQTVAFSQKQKIDLRILVYLNRFSDLLFMLARFVNHEAGRVEVTWQGIDSDKIVVDRKSKKK